MDIREHAPFFSHLVPGLKRKLQFSFCKTSLLHVMAYVGLFFFFFTKNIATNPTAIYVWYPTAVPSPIAVHGPISGPKDHCRAVDRYSGRSYRSKRLEFRFAVAVHSPIAVHGPVTVQPEFFKFPRRNVPLGISLSTDFSAFSSFRQETCESTSLSALIFAPFQEQKKVWRGLPGIFVRCVVLFLSFFLFDTVRCLFKRRREKVWRGTPWFKEGNTHRETNLFSKCQLIAVRTRSLGGLSPRSVCS